MLRNTFKEIFNNKIDALGLSVFRVLYALVLFCETSQLFRYRHIIYDKDPFVSVGEIDVTFIFLFWFIVLGMLMLGFYTRFATVLNYIFGVIIFSSAKHFEYHIFYIYVGINFLLMFMPISRVFSIDSLCRKIKYSRIGFEYKEDRKILEINYIILVFSAIALVYFDSIFQKLASPMWLEGLGMWLPSSLPMVTWNDTSVFLNQELLMKFLGYLVLVFEGLFIFLFWFRSLRIPLMLIGILFHIGILIIYPIPWFALTLIAVYLLMLPETFWFRISKMFKSRSQGYRFYYDAECPLCIKVVVAIKHIDVFNRISCLSVQDYASKEPALRGVPEEELLKNIHGVTKKGKVYVGYNAYRNLFVQIIYTFPLSVIMVFPGLSVLGKRLYRYIAGERLTTRCADQNCRIPLYSVAQSERHEVFISDLKRLKITKLFWKVVLITLFFFQCLVVFFSPVIQEKLKSLSRLNSRWNSYLFNSSFSIKKYIGVARHDVFVKEHFNYYNHIFKIVCTDKNKVFTPFLDNNGMPTSNCVGVIWRNISFEAVSPWLNQSRLEWGLKPYLLYLNSKKRTAIQIFVKEIEIPEKWEKDFLHNQIKKPWNKAADCFVSDNKVNFIWTDQMKMIFKIENHILTSQ